MYIELNRNIKKEKIEESEREKALKKLQNSGIIDKDGNLIGKYKELFVKSQKEKVIDNWKNYVEEQKSDIPNIPNISDKNYRKTINKK